MNKNKSILILLNVYEAISESNGADFFSGLATLTGNFLINVNLEHVWKNSIYVCFHVQFKLSWLL